MSMNNKKYKYKLQNNNLNNKNPIERYLTHIHLIHHTISVTNESIFMIKDIDKIFLLFCDVIDDLIIIKQLNKYYSQLINNNILFQSWIKLY